MRSLGLLAAVLVITLGRVPFCLGATDTPGHWTAYCLEPSLAVHTNNSDLYRAVMSNQTYVLTNARYDADQDPSSERVTVTDFVEALASGYGVFWFSLHSAYYDLYTPGHVIGIIEIATYPDNAAGNTARDDDFTALQAMYPPYAPNGPPRIVKFNNTNDYGSVASIAVTSPMLEEHFLGSRTLVFAGGCASNAFNEVWFSPVSGSPARAQIGWPSTVGCPNIGAASNDFFQRLNGLHGSSKRVVQAAFQDIQAAHGVALRGDGDIVLCPRVEAVYPVAETVIEYERSGYVVFDVPMEHVGSMENVVIPSGGITVRNVRWDAEDRHILRYTVGATGTNPGTIRVRTVSGPTSTIAGARSIASHIGFDGDGQGSHNDFEVFYLGGGSTIDAFIGHMSARRQAAGVEVRWVAEYEDSCLQYLVERADGWWGPWSLCGVVPGAHLRQYSHLDAGAEAGYYRLREVTVRGDTLVHRLAATDSSEAPGPPESLPPADSLHAAQVAQYSSSGGVGVSPAGAIWLAVTRDEWVAAAQPLADFWTGRGKPAAVVGLSAVGGSIGDQGIPREPVGGGEPPIRDATWRRE